MASYFSPIPRRWLPVALALAVGLSLLPAQPALATSEQAQQADSFVDSIGVNIHLHYTDTVYNDFGTIRPILENLGIRHLRDSVYTYNGVSANHFFYERARELGASGMRFSLLTSIESRNSDKTNLELLDDIYEWTDGAVVMYEGTNEPDIFGDDDTWVERTVQLQEELWNTVQNNPTLAADVDVAGPSPAFEPGALPDLSAYLDYGNWHGYTGGVCVYCERGGDFALNLLPAHQTVSGDAPVMITETGYHTGVNVPASEGHNPVSETAQAIYVPRLLLEYFNSGIPRSYLYELMDLFDDPERSEREYNFGLVRNDGTPKPAYTALQNLIAILDDPGPSFETESLDYTLNGNTTDVHSTLLQKRDGTFYLALWREVPSWDIETRQDIEVESEPVSLWLGSPAVLDTYRPNISADPVDSSQGATIQLDLDLDDEVQIVAIRDPSVEELTEVSALQHAINLIPIVLMRMKIPFAPMLYGLLHRP